MAIVTGTSLGDFIHRAGDGRSGGGNPVTGVTTGADTISGAEGNDLIYGDDGNDTISGGSGDDILYGGQGADALIGGVGYDIFRFEAASEVTGLAESFDGGADHDRLDFGSAFGVIDLSLATIVNIEELNVSGAGNNTITLTAAQLGAFSTISAGFGQDILILSAAGTADLTGASISGIDEIRGSAGNDVIALAGVSNGQTVNGAAGNDTITGGTGADVLDGGAGKDLLTGGGGADRFVLSVIGDSPASANRDVITGFSQVEGDRIDLSRIDASTAVVGDQAFSFIGTGLYTGVAGQLRYSQTGSATVVAGDVNGDGVSDFHVEISGTFVLGAIDFVL